MIDEFLWLTDGIAKNILLENFGVPIKEEKEMIPEIDEFNYSGVVGILGIVGETKGRVMLGMDFSMVEHLVKIVYGSDVITNTDILDVAYEVFNIITGNAAIECKNKMNIFIRPTPPSIFLGESMLIVSPKIQRKKIEYVSEYGMMFLEVGFERGR